MHTINNDFNIKLIKKNLDQKGLYTVRNFIEKKIINQIKLKVLKNLNKKKKILVAKNIKKSLLKGQPISTFTKDLKYNLTQKEILRGYKYYSKLTNRVLLRDPLLNYREINRIIYNKKIINLCDKYFKRPAKLGFIALNCDFKNNLPQNDVNLFHTDDSSCTKNKKKDLMLKIAIPLHLKKNSFFEYRHIFINKKKLGMTKQYFSRKELNSNQKKYILNPKVKSRDIVIFDPNNFYHCGEKTKYPVRIVLTVVYIQSKCYLRNKAKNIKIYSSDFNSLDNYQKKFLEYISVIK